MKSSKYEYRVVTAPDGLWVEFRNHGSEKWMRLNFCHDADEAERKIEDHVEDDDYESSDMDGAIADHYWNKHKTNLEDAQ